MPAVEEEPADDLAELRRRLYRPAATAEDVRRYTAALPDEEAVADAGSGGPPPAAPPRRSRRGPALLLAAAALIAAVGGAVALRSATPTGSSGIAPARAATSRAELVSPGAVPMSVHGEPALGHEVRASGPLTVPVDATGAASVGGRLVVELTAPSPTRISWYAARLVLGSDGDLHQEVVARDPVRLRGASPDPAEVVYEGAPPSLIVVAAPAGARWSITTAVLTP